MITEGKWFLVVFFLWCLVFCWFSCFVFGGVFLFVCLFLTTKTSYSFFPATYNAVNFV